MNDSTLTMYSTQSCAMSEISGLSNYKDKPKLAMQHFCRLNIKETEGLMYHRYQGLTGKMFAMYSFSAPVYKAGRSGGEYGPQFAKFIKENKLGIVIQTPAVENEIFHPDHKNRVWIWVVNKENLKKWWKENPLPLKMPTKKSEVHWYNVTYSVGIKCMCGKCGGIDIGKPRYMSFEIDGQTHYWAEKCALELEKTLAD